MKHHFDRPPINEVACGLQFSGVDWAEYQFGVFFSEVAAEYDLPPKTQPALPSYPLRQEIVFATKLPSPRTWYESSKTPFLIQVQSDRFLLNWREQKDRGPYPHFISGIPTSLGVYDKFKFEWDKYCKYCSKKDIGTPEIAFAELTYVDHFVQGEDWDCPADLAKLFNLLQPLQTKTNLEKIGIRLEFNVNSMPLNMSFRSATRLSDNKSIIALEMTIVSPTSAEKYDEWFRSANAAITEFFVDSLTENAKNIWGYKYA